MARTRGSWTFAPALLLWAAMASAGFQSTELFLPAVGRVEGNLGSQFYTTVWLTNLGSSSTSFTFQFLKQGQANTSPASFSGSLAPGETKMYENVVETQLGESSAIGAARIVSGGEILAAERIYNQPPSADLGDTEGLFFSGVPKSFSIALGETATIQGINQGGSENFRYNFALVETGGGSPTVHVRVLDASGNQLGAKDYVLQPYEQIQPNVTDVVPAIATTNARVAATVTAGTGSVLLAGAQVANVTQDSSGFEMGFKDSLLSGSTAGVASLNGLTGAVSLVAGSNISITPSGSSLVIAATGAGAVNHDATLAGDGSLGAPLGLAVPLTLAGSANPMVQISSSDASSYAAGLSSELTSTSPGPFAAAVYGSSAGTGGNGVGVWGNQDGSGWGVYGTVGGAGTGVFGSAPGAGVGVEGQAGGYEPPNASAALSGSVGVFGTSTDGIGVFGASGSTTKGNSYGVHGEGAVGVDGVGTVVLNNSGNNVCYGVEGDSYLAGDLRVGVYGYADGGTTNYAGYFYGNVNVVGNLSKSGGSFKIDDPIDPANKYLYHSFVESPDMKNIYDGVARLDQNGMAKVDLPAWFQSLNQDFRYQLTAIGTSQPGLYVAREVQDNSFTIAGGVPGAKVSWQVTGIRHDAWANAHRIPVEVEKPPADRGYYLTPAESGQPVEKGIEWRTNPQYRLAVERQRAAEAAEKNP